jgi:hypothetical protein
VEPVELSRRLLQKVREEGATGELESELSKLDRWELVESISADRYRKAFWINLYNAEAQILSIQHPALRRTRLVYLVPFLRVGDLRLSLTGLENGMLRRKTVFGTRKPGLLVSDMERNLRVDRVDPRIHFALNCAAGSCPPIRFYSAEDIDERLEMATEAYLDSEVEIEGNSAKVPRVFKWYAEDFGGREGVKDFLEERGFRFDSLEFLSWDWSVDTGRFH